MWLAATDKGLGFQLVSATGTMSNHRAFIELLGLPRGEYDLDGCLIGLPEDDADTQKKAAMHGMAVWF